MATKITVDANVESFVRKIDKAAESVEYFGKTGEDAIKEVGKSYEGLTEKQKRSFDASKQQFNENIKKIKDLEAEYEKLRNKQKSGQNLNKEEFDRLKKIEKEYKNLRGAVSQTSRELNTMAKACKNVTKGENDIKSKTPQATHVLANMAAEAVNVKTALVAAAGAFASFGLDAEKQIKQFEAVTGSLNEATLAFNELQDINAKLNFDDVDLAHYAKMLLNVGVSADKLGGIFDRLADAIAGVGGDSGNFEELLDIFLRIENIGRMTMEDLEALQELGFGNILQDMSKTINGGDTHTLYKQIQDEAVDSDVAINAILKYFDKFDGAVEKSTDNIVDNWSQAMKDMASGAGSVGKGLADDLGIKELVKMVKDFAKNFKAAARDFEKDLIGPLELMDRVLGKTLSKLVQFYAAYKGLGVLAKGGKAVFDAAKSSKILDGITAATAATEGLGVALAKTKNEGAETMKQFLITSANIAIDQMDGPLDKLLDEIDDAKAEVDELKRQRDNMQDLVQRGHGDLLPPGAFENTQFGLDAAEEKLKKKNEAYDKLQAKQAKWVEFVEKADKKETASHRKRIKALDGVGKKVDGLGKKAVKNQGFFTKFGNSIKNGFKGCTKAAKGFFTALNVTSIVSGLKAMGAGILQFGKNAATVGASLATKLSLPLSIAATWAMSLADSLEKAEHFDYAALYRRATAGEGPLDPEDPEDRYTATEKWLEETGKKAKEADKQKKEAAAEEEKESDEDKNREKADNEEKYQQELEKQKEYLKNLQDIEHEAAMNRLEQKQYINEEELNQKAKFYKNLTNMLESYGAHEAAMDNEALDRKIEMDQALLSAENEYAKERLSILQQIEGLESEKQFAEDARDIDIINRQIEELRHNLDDLMINHENDLIKIKVEADLNDIQAKLARKVNELAQNRAYEDDGEAGEIMQFGNMMYNGLQAGTLTNFNENSQALAEAQANGDAAGIMSIGQMLGLSVEEIQAKGEAIQDMYSVVQEAMVNATATEIDMNNQAFEAVNEHAENVKKLQDVVTDYCMGIANNFAGAFSDWVMGAKTAGQAIKDFATTLVQNIIQMAAQFAGLCGILAAFGVIPPGPVAAKMMFGYNSGHQYDAGSRGDRFMKKANGGYITGPGTSTSDSIPAMLSAGEYVLNARAVKAIGVGNLNMMNNAHTPKFAEGGLVGHNDAPAPAPVNNVTVQVSAVDATSFAGFLKRGGLNKIKQAMFDDSRNFAGLDGVF